MAYVVTQACCADASCVVACPVNCIHPTPGEPGFAEAEMLYIDPKSCVGCGACVTACPVGAIKPESRLTPEEQPFSVLNAAYYDEYSHADRTPLALVPPQRRLVDPRPVRVAVVGAGPAGLYAADELLRHPEVSVDVLDRLPTPYGLLRAGVAPDHHHTKGAEKLFRAIEEQPGFRYLLGVEVGRDLTHAELAEHYDAVITCVGAAADKRLGVDGETLPGSLSATELVAWYNGHPERQDLDVPLDHERAVVIGTGNVALDVARILTADPEALARTDIASGPLDALAASDVREVVVLGRRGPDDAAFTLPELVGLAGLPDVDVLLDPGGADITATGERGRLLRDLASRERRPGRRAIILRFHTQPVAVLGETRVEGLAVRGTHPTLTGAETLDTGLVLRAIGYHGKPVPGLPYDDVAGTVPNDRGRVEPGSYVAGWIKRGPTGFIGTNKSCAQETVTQLLDDLDAGLVPVPPRRGEDLRERLADRGVDPIDLAGWRAIDRQEKHRGAISGRSRAKIVALDELRAAATSSLRETV
ncbi:4Fe-4S dicluster domain-containing protein [Nocardioides seonyuensis]|uniref:ferredoxin--NADP(+) reductase n=1 Tax=Nocardioides seonyuensis TaxID=2518371 RepID=A0A4P7IK75_9ACTN|nr:FAD-dependent oxidoreductase [Nocardioides seonyuensis]QBX57233.1 4Fe-4S dicluster domain-containing protein [Nocardioides seonyuensis]